MAVRVVGEAFWAGKGATVALDRMTSKLTLLTQADADLSSFSVGIRKRKRKREDKRGRGQE
jgi:hypothetical protein